MRYVWLHGFASGPTSSKGQFVRARLAERGETLLLPDLNAPSFFDLTVTRMLSDVDRAVGPSGDVVLFGSSLGGFTAATWAATRPGRCRALVLLAPAFDLAGRWEKRMGSAARDWERTGRYAFDHYAHGGKEELSFGFITDARRYEAFPLPTCPTLVIQGTKDDTVDPELAREFTHRMNGRAKLVELPEGHELTGDLPALWRHITNFLSASR
jgi:pimeloyl-ACP methyl ester carboxylesterase